MARPKKPETLALSAPARFWLTKTEYQALGRRARIQGKTISAFARQAVLAAVTAGTDVKQRGAL